MLAKELIRQVRRIEIKTRRLVDENLAGKYHSAFKGQGMEFSETRAYQAGDDIRSIDWNVTARMGEPFIKKFVEERELTVMLLVDMSGSQEFGSTFRSKRDLAAELTALFALSAIKNQDKVGCLIFTDRVECYIAPKKGQKHVLRLIREILAFEPKRVGTQIGEALRFFMQVAKRKCVVFLISDFMDSGFLSPMQAVQARHDLIALPILDPLEVTPPQAGLFMLEDGETGREVLVDFSSAAVRAAFRDAHVRRKNELDQTFLKSKVDSIPMVCGTAYEQNLIRFFKRRELKK
jgi:uncharacterized protein (DUF58 family)